VASKVFILTGVDDLLNRDHISPTDRGGYQTITHRFHEHLDRVMTRVTDEARYLELNLTTILCTPTLARESFDGASNDMDDLLEEFSAVVYRVAEEYHSPVVELRFQILKYLEAFNDEHLPWSVLTHDGTHMNRVAHQLVAAVLLDAMGFDSHRLLSSAELNDRKVIKDHQKKDENALNDRDEIEIESTSIDEEDQEDQQQRREELNERADGEGDEEGVRNSRRQPDSDSVGEGDGDHDSIGIDGDSEADSHYVDETEIIPYEDEVELGIHHPRYQHNEL
jgi:hypothetical protein